MDVRDKKGQMQGKANRLAHLPVGLLQFTALRSGGHSTAQAAVCAECHCTTDHWHATLWSYLAGITQTPLATHPRALQVQSGMRGSPVAVRAGASLLGRRLVSRVRQHSALSAVSWRFDLCGAAKTQQLWWQNFCSRGTSPVKLPIQLRNPDITYGCSDDSWRDVFGKHEHGALWLLICGTIEKHLLTYLTTPLAICIPASQLTFLLTPFTKCHETKQKPTKIVAMAASLPGSN